MRNSLIAGALLVAAPAAVGAQDGAPRDSVVKLPPVSVTAARGATSILATPLAVSRLSNAELRGVVGYGLDEALSRVPGVIAQSRYGTSDIRLMIRGYGARGAGDRSNSGTTRGVRVLLDGIPETEPDGRTALDQVDLATAEAVEVVRSNASALWGNAAGGVVNVITAPSVSAPTLELQPMFGSFGLERYAVRAATPAGAGGDGVLYANFTHTSFEGWRQHSSSRRALVNGGALGTFGGTRLGLYLTAADNLLRVPGPLTQAQLDADPSQANATYAARDERRHNRTGRLGVTVERALSAATSLSSMLYVNPKHLERSERNTYRDFTRYHVGGNVVGRTSFVAGGVRSHLTVGADAAYQDGAILFYALSATQGRDTTLVDNKGEGAANFGLFVQDQLALGERLSLLLGARFDQVTYDYRSYLPSPPVSADRRDFRRVSPKLGLNWLLDATHAAYVNVGGGIEVPAGNETDPTPGAPPALLNPLLDPIRSTTYELGFKSLGDHTDRASRAYTLDYDAALYDIEVTNEAVPYSGGRYYLTAGRARRRGAELGAAAALRAGPFANVALTLSDNEYLHYVVDSSVIFPADPSKVGQRADYSGNRVVGLPGVLANVELGSEVPGLRALRLKAGVEHAGRYYADDANHVAVPAYTILNLTAELRDPILAGNGLGLRGFVTLRNVADQRYVGSAFLNPDFVDGAPAAYEPGAPRSLLVSISVGKLR